MDEAVDEVMDEMYSKVADRGLLKADIVAVVTRPLAATSISSGPSPRSTI